MNYLWRTEATAAGTIWINPDSLAMPNLWTVFDGAVASLGTNATGPVAQSNE